MDGVLLAGFHGLVRGLANAFIEFHVDLACRAKQGDWAGASDLRGRICALLDIYMYPIWSGSFNAVVLVALKEASVLRGLISTSTTSSPFSQADDGLRLLVANFLARAKGLAL